MENVISITDGSLMAKLHNRIVKRLQADDRVLIPCQSGKLQAVRGCVQCGAPGVLTTTGYFVCRSCEIIFA